MKVHEVVLDGRLRLVTFHHYDTEYAFCAAGAYTRYHRNQEGVFISSRKCKTQSVVLDREGQTYMVVRGPNIDSDYLQPLERVTND